MLCDAFDAAWVAINAEQEVDPVHSTQERERLAHLITHLWQTGAKERLAEEAALQFFKGASSLLPQDPQSIVRPER